jgi:phosphoribosylanthranilate isomerase
MTKIKICGLTKIADIGVVNEILPEYAGFVFAKSHRQVTMEVAKELISHLENSVQPVGVFVNEEIEAIFDIVTHCGLKVVQLHGDEGNVFISKLRTVLNPEIEIWKAVRVKSSETFFYLDELIADRILLDAWDAKDMGGTGSRFDWKLTKDVKIPFMLAGGLNSENVAEAIRVAKPWGLDVSSGVETDKCKDEKKMRCFVNEVRKFS